MVHFRSGGMLADIVADIRKQQGVDVVIHVVESGSDGTVEAVEAADPSGLLVHRPGRNVGYAGGNNIAFDALQDLDYVLVVNPDVRITDPTTLSRLHAHLEGDVEAAAVAPVIVKDSVIEYADSHIDLRRGVAVHTTTQVESWPWPTPVHDISWIDGACLLIRTQALREVGGFDERFFLIAEEVDWCLRMRGAGWRLLLAADAQIQHQRSSSFGTSTKSAYYHARNTYLLFTMHGLGRSWRWHWAARQARAAVSRSHLRSGATLSLLRGVLHAVIGRWGPAPEDL